MKHFDPEEYLIFSCVAGSRLYGTNSTDSDEDIRSVCLPPMQVLLNPFDKFNVKDAFEDEDKVVYDLGKFINLCADNNPSLLELLFVPDKFVLYRTNLWDKIVENRHLFLSKNVKHRFLGYSFAMLKRIERHRQWFLNPPDHKPTREEFGLGQTSLVSEANIQNMMGVPNDLFKEEYYEELQRERKYREVKKKWDNYIQWKTNRNPKRKGTEEEFGYDLKYATHLFRLMSEGKELLLAGNITFPLPNAEWLLLIKNGFYSYEKILEMAKSMEQDFELWYEQSPLPKVPDRNALKELYFDIVLGKNR